MPLPMGEVAEQSEDGEGKQIDLIIQKRCFSPLSHLTVTVLPKGDPRAYHIAC